ncbi:hypothetical protein F3K36_29915 [Delftia sp. BR1]|nr:hypothetical protein F3K36_29915 [Delftia sp. BR1]
MAAPPGRQGLPAELAARGGRSAVRRGRLAAPAVLALRVLHGHRQVPALCGDDGGAAAAAAGLLGQLRPKPPHRSPPLLRSTPAARAPRAPARNARPGNR